MICQLHGDYGAHFNECPQCAQLQTYVCKNQRCDWQKNSQTPIYQCPICGDVAVVYVATPPAQSDTPRTDAATENGQGTGGPSYALLLAFANALERELTAALAEIARLNEQLNLLQK